jgi:hypothetical protein
MTEHTPFIWLPERVKSGRADCGCVLEYSPDPSYYQCTMHEAAPEMLAALYAGMALLDDGTPWDDLSPVEQRAQTAMRTAIAAATGDVILRVIAEVQALERFKIYSGGIDPHDAIEAAIRTDEAAKYTIDSEYAVDELGEHIALRCTDCGEYERAENENAADLWAHAHECDTSGFETRYAEGIGESPTYRQHMHDAGRGGLLR